MASVPSKSNDMGKNVEIDMVERCETVSNDMPEITQSTTVGTITLNDSEDTFLVPSPSTDPRGKKHSLNIAYSSATLTWRYRPTQHANLEEAIASSACLYLYGPVIVSVDAINIFIVSSVGLSMVSGFGGLLGFYIPGYVER